jgi:high-affinity nickel-transport protein
MTYALGHAFTVAALGIAVLQLHMGLPEGLDHWTERLIGLTLIVLGIGVVAGILRKDAHGHRHSRIESRLAIAINGVLWLAWRVRRTWNPMAPKPERFQWMYNGKSVFAIGILHGVGAETPSQLGLFLLTMTASIGGAFNAGGHHPRIYHVIAWTGAVYSCGIGLIFLLGISDRLPALS